MISGVLLNRVVHPISPLSNIANSCNFLVSVQFANFVTFNVAYTEKNLAIVCHFYSALIVFLKTIANFASFGYFQCHLVVDFLKKTA